MKKYIIVDGYIDVLYCVYNKWVDVIEGIVDGDFDYFCVVLGGLNVLFMLIYVLVSLDNLDEFI